MIYDGEYEIRYKNELACYIDTPTGQQKRWRVWTVGDYSDEFDGFPIDERTKEIARSNVVKCGNCDGCDRNPGKTEVIFGKEFINVCNGTNNLAMLFTNPDAEALECAKKWLRWRCMLSTFAPTKHSKFKFILLTKSYRPQLSN